MRLGVDIGGTKTDVVVLGGADILARRRVSSGFGAEEVIAQARLAVDGALADAGATLADIESVGVGVPGGVVDGVVSYALNLGIERADLGTELGALWGVRPVIDNDVNAAALGAWVMEGEPRGSFAYLNLGTGLAAGIIVDGQLWRGSRGTAGEIGHVSVDPHGPADADGMPGCLETYASGSGLVRQWGVEGAIATDVLDAAARGDARAVEIRDRLYLGLAHSLRVLVLTFDVDRIAIGGGLAGIGAPLMDGMRRVVAGWSASSPFLASLELAERASLLDSDAPIAALGAAQLGAAHG